MKKLLSILICVVLCFAFSGCKNEKKQTLINAMSGAEDISVIDSFQITHEYGDPTVITDKKDYKFLEKYTYSHKYPADKVHEVFVFPGNRVGNASIDGETVNIYIAKEGNIVLQKNAVTGVGFEVFTANEKISVTDEKLKKLLIKYGVEQKTIDNIDAYN